MTTPVLSPAPYITPELLKSASTGISWDTIPTRNSTPAQRLAEQWNICRRATAMCDTEANQRLRATVSTEQIRGPDYRVTVNNNGSGTSNIILSRKPILEVLSGQWAVNNPPLQWQPIPGNAFVVNQPSPGVWNSIAPGDAAESGQSVTLGSGYMTWLNGRFGTFLSVTYISGFPMCQLTAAVAAGVTSLPVDDCTGWSPIVTSGPGGSGVLYDAANEENVSSNAASAASGPGNILLTQPTNYAHPAGTLLSGMPSQIIQACIYFAISMALVRGATATAAQTMAGGMVHGDNPEMYASEAELLIKPYRRTT